MSFFHLHVHSHYSLLKASSTIGSLVKKCEEQNLPGYALTDYGNLFGALEHYFKCKEKGLKPILGLEVYLTKDHLEKKHKILHHQSQTLVLLVQNLEGYRNICQLSTIGYQKGFYYIPRIDISILKKYSKGLLALTGGHIGKIFQTYKNFGSERALDDLQEIKDIFQDRLYLEYTKTNPKNYNQFLKEASLSTSIPLVAANDVHYTDKKDHIIQDALVCIGNNKTLRDEDREKLPHNDFYFKSPQQMAALFKDEPEVLQRTLEVAGRCHLEFNVIDKKGKPIYHLPNPNLEKRKNPLSELKYLAQKGLKNHIQNLDVQNDPKKIKEYEDRLEKELQIIRSMGFEGYFLIVHEFVHWAKERDIPVGPGRGSGASSLVAYTLGITDLDPMSQNLLFERFLNPERVSMPDFDIDFCQEKRNQVIKHVHDTYGKDYVAQVITFGRLQARAAIRDIGRILDIPYSEVDVIAKLIPDRLGIKLSEAVKISGELKELMETDSQTATLMDLAQRIEGLVRHVSIHAAGVIIADQPVIHYAPLYRGSDDENVIQFDLKYAKKIGLVKFDFLGLKTLTHLKEAFKLIKQNRNKEVTSKDISLHDPGIYKIMNRGDTLGVFQFEGYGITDLTRRAKPKCFEDIIALNALFRPGPMDMIDLYLERRRSKTAHYIFPELKDLLKETHGIVVYQEQVLLISSMIGGYSLGEADILRRAMAEKIPSEMGRQKNRFLRGAKERGFDPEKSEKLFDTVAEFAKYGFNKAHATAYCVLAAQTAWLKYHFPVEFFASLLTTEMADTNKITRYIKNAIEHGIKIKSPHINNSKYNFYVEGDSIYFALGAVKGVGKLAVEDILNVRDNLKDKKFTSFDHFLELMDTRRVNKKTIDSLVKAGAFDNLGYERFEILSNFEHLIERAEKKKQDRRTGQSDLFEFYSQDERVFQSKGRKWSDLEKLNHEKSVIGFYLSQHPLDHFRLITNYLPSESIRSAKSKNTSTVALWGLVNDLKETVTRKGDIMGFAQLEDQTDYLNLIFFPKIYIEFEKFIKMDEPIHIEGRLNFDEDIAKCIVNRVTPLSVFLSQIKRIEIEVPEKAPSDSLNQLKKIMKENEGSTSIVFKLNVNGSYLNLESKDPSGLRVNHTVLEEITKIIPNKNIELQADR